ncbi:MAG TPA: phage baseplate assembly protein V, partial [Thermoanaerobaculia bacterium]|nr:phage baseplate assembly protein V [Thermoanaerobaculia bacterium]
YNKDPEGLGRVKLRFPWLSEKEESDWARVISPMAGGDRGLYVLPEVNDEVLVAFEHGRAELTYVLGSLWNGKDKPPAANEDGKNNLRVLKSRSGHLVRLDDTAGGEKIEIVDAQGKQSIVFDTAAGTLTLTAEQDVVIEAKNGLLKLSGKKGVEIVAPDGAGKLEVGQDVDIKAGGQVNVKGTVINLN